MPNATVRANDRALPEATNRRAVLSGFLLAGAAAATALPASAAPGLTALSTIDRVMAGAEPDPVLGLVANLSVAWDQLGEALKETTHFEYHPLVEKAHCEIDAALAELQATPPTTLAGARAAIEWLVEYDEHNAPEDSGLYLRTLSRSPIFAQPEALTALPTAANSQPALSTIDRRVLGLWYRRAKLRAISTGLKDAMLAESGAEEEGLSDRYEDSIDALNNLEDKFEEHLGTSVLALAAIFMIWIGDEPREGLHRACLAAIRRQLVGAIAEDADRVLAQVEEEVA
jgi:hypothetical protein